MELLKADLAVVENPDLHHAKGFLNSTILQLQVAPFVLKWGEKLLAQVVDWGKKLGLPDGTGLSLESLDGLLEKYHRKEKKKTNIFNSTAAALNR